MTKQENAARLTYTSIKDRKKDECRSSLFDISRKEEGILVDHADGGIDKSMNRQSA
jgi:hypothetical protein